MSTPPTHPAFYGVALFDTEYETLIAIGHPPRRRLIAAANAYARREWGLCNLLDDPGGTVAQLDAPGTIAYRWARPTTETERSASVDGDSHIWCAEGEPGAQPFVEIDLR
jgi:hypothetical protein